MLPPCDPDSESACSPRFGTRASHDPTFLMGEGEGEGREGARSERSAKMRCEA